MKFWWWKNTRMATPRLRAVNHGVSCLPAPLRELQGFMWFDSGEMWARSVGCRRTECIYMPSASFFSSAWQRPRLRSRNKKRDPKRVYLCGSGDGLWDGKTWCTLSCILKRKEKTKRELIWGWAISGIYPMYCGLRCIKWLYHQYRDHKLSRPILWRRQHKVDRLKLPR